MRALALAIPAALALALFAPASSRADVVVAVDLSGIAPLDDAGDGLGYGADGRLGYQLSLVAISLTPEVGGGFLTFPLTGDGDATVTRGFAGARFAIGAIITPSVFAHIGYGKSSVTVAGAEASENGMTLDAGGAVDFTALPVLSIGVHGGWNRISTDGGDASWASFGAHASLTF